MGGVEMSGINYEGLVRGGGIERSGSGRQE